jgi:cyclic pyranopterin phosphate synthase
VAEVMHLFQALEHKKPVTEFEAVEAVENKGFRDCLHGHSETPRQVLLIDSETLEEFGVAPGRGKENVTTRGLDLTKIEIGQRLRMGGALLEVTESCEPCRLMDEIRDGLQEQIRGRRGILCRVVRSGKIQRGDRIEIVPS